MSSSINPNSATTGHHINTVFIIAMENHNWTGGGADSLKGNPSAPYLNGTLIPQASHAENYWNPPHNHPSLPNYLWLEAGTNFGIHSDGTPLEFSQTTTLHLTGLLQQANIPWKSYQEDISGKTCDLQHWHDGAVFFTDVTDNNDPNSPNCIAHVRPLTELQTDLAAGTTGRYNFITPNYCHSMHVDPVYCPGDPILNGDTWLKTIVPTILASNAYKNGGAIFIVWDEAATGDGPIPLLVLSPFAKGHGYSNNIQYTHSSTLRTMQEIFGLGQPMRDAANWPDLSDLFTAFP